MKEQYHLVSFSGGKDSTAMLLGMLERDMKIDCTLFCDTGLEFPAMFKRNGYIVCNYDRGWDIEPADENTQLALELLLHSENW